MKNNLFHMGCCQYWLMVLTLVCFTWGTPNQVWAKLKVTRTVSTISTKSLNSSSRPKINYSLDCEGLPLWITADTKGITHVYVNEHGSGFCNCNDCEVELPAEYQITWSNVTIFTGISGNENEVINAKMDGGSVGVISLENRASGNRTVNMSITGGRLNLLNLPISGTCNAYMSNARYSGSRIYTPANANCVLFVNNDCEFYSEGAIPSDESLSALRGAIVPDCENPQDIRAYGAAYVPANTRVVCDNFIDKGMTSLTLGSGASITVNKCNGWKSTMSKPSGVKVQDHNKISYVIQAQTCVNPERTRTYCDLCGEYDLISVTKQKLGHSLVTDDAIAATCLADGLTEGKHCQRCGFVSILQTVVSAKDHVKDITNPITINFTKKTVVGQKSTDQLKAMIERLSGCFAGDAVTFYPCKNCDDFITTTKPNHAGNVTWITGTIPSSARCTRNFVREGRCSACKLKVYSTLSARNHSSKTTVAGSNATCTTAGCKTYQKCSYCDQKFKTDGTAFDDMSVVEIPPTGHAYGESGSYQVKDAAKVSVATCSSPAVYHQSCAKCGAINNRLIFYEGAALGHQYHLKSIDYKDPDYPDEGYLTVECQRSSCQRTWPGLLFMISDKIGTIKEDGTYNGYWSKTQLIKTIEMPTCVPGWGKYHLDFNFHGTEMSAEYENYITPMGYVHNYDEHGVCHEQHYIWERDEDGSIVKYFAGEIQNENFGNRNRGEYIYKYDSTTVYSTQGYVAVPYQAECMYDDGKTPVTDPKDGSQMYYTDYRVVDASNQQEFLEAIANLPEDEAFYAKYYGDLSMNIADATSLQAVKKLTCGNQLNVNDWNPFSQQNCAYLNDQTDLQIAENVHVPGLCYKRTFNKAKVWEPYAIPMDVDPEQYTDVCDFAEIYSFGNVYDSNSDGMLDEKDDMWLIVSLLNPRTDVVNANLPYLVRPKQAGNYTFAAYEGRLYSGGVEELDCSTATTQYTFKGGYHPVNLSANNRFLEMKEGSLQPLKQPSTIAPQRWYVEATPVTGGYNKSLNSASASSIRVMVIGEEMEEETAIRLLRGESVDVWKDGKHYTLDGRKAAITPAGLQIVNGCKMIVK